MTAQATPSDRARSNETTQEGIWLGWFFIASVIFLMIAGWKILTATEVSPVMVAALVILGIGCAGLGALVFLMEGIQPFEPMYAYVLTGLAFVLMLIALANPSLASDGNNNPVIVPETTTTTTAAPATDAAPGREFCPGGIGDDLRFDTSELSNPQALYPALPKQRVLMDEALWGENGYACGNAQVLVSLAVGINEEKIFGQSLTGENLATAGEWVDYLRTNPEAREPFALAVYREWKRLAMKMTVNDETFGGSIYRLAPAGDTELVYDLYGVPEAGMVVTTFEYPLTEGAGGIVERYLGLETGWWFSESVVGMLASEVDLEDNPQVAPEGEEVVTAPPAEQAGAGDKPTATEGETTPSTGGTSAGTGDKGTGGNEGDKPSDTEGPGGDNPGGCGDDCGGSGGGETCTDDCEEPPCSTCGSSTTSTSSTTTTVPATTTTVPVTTTTKPTTTTTTTQPTTTTTEAPKYVDFKVRIRSVGANLWQLYLKTDVEEPTGCISGYSPAMGTVFDASAPNYGGMTFVPSTGRLMVRVTGFGCNGWLNATLNTNQVDPPGGGY